MANWTERTLSFLTIYFLDFVISVGILTAAWFIPYFGAHRRFFVERDPALSYPYIEDRTFSFWEIFAMSMGVPVVGVLIIQIWSLATKWEVWEVTRNKCLVKNKLLPYLALLHALSLTMFTVNFFKVFTGRPRPNFFAMCNYKGYRDALESGDFASYFDNTIVGEEGSETFCLETNSAIIEEAMSSFPSGFAALISVGFGFLTFFLGDVVPIPDYSPSGKRQWTAFLLRFKTFRMTVPYVIIGSAIWISLLGAKEYWSNIDDMLTGIIIGLLSAKGAVWAFKTDPRDDKVDLPAISTDEFLI